MYNLEKFYTPTLDRGVIINCRQKSIFCIIIQVHKPPVGSKEMVHTVLVFNINIFPWELECALS